MNVMEKKAPHAELVGNYVKDIDNMLTLFIKKKEDKEWAHDEIVNGGPLHKQVLSALLLSKAYELIKKTEQRTGEKFKPVKQTAVINNKYEEEYRMPVDVILPEEGEDNENIAGFIAKAPDHESLVYLMALQAIEWAAKQQ